MVRLSDILKKKLGAEVSSKPQEESLAPQEEAVRLQQEPEKPQEEELKLQQEKKEAQTPTISISEIIQKKKLNEQEPQEMQISKAMKEIQPDIEYFRRLYSDGIQLLKKLSENIKSGKKDFSEIKSLKNIILEAVNRIVLGDNSFIAIVCEDYPESEYLYRHMVNVMFISISLGLELNYNKSTLNELGLASFLHDVGLIQLGFDAKPGVLSKEERQDIKKHADKGAEIIDSFEDSVSKDATIAVKEHHERFNGAGYTRGLKDGEISEFARIIGPVDVYEALTHARAYRKHKKFLPHEAIRMMLTDNQGEFDPEILKTFVNQIGIYPVGSWVELSTDEIAKVITPNTHFPIRPVVNIIFNSSRKTLKEPRLVNLSKQFSIYIKKTLLDEEVQNLIN